MLLALSVAAPALAQEPPAIEGLRVEDAPNDAGTAIAAFWPAAPGERPPAEGAAPPAPTPTYEYVVSVAAAGPFVEVARLPARTGWAADLADKLGVGARWSEEHAALVSPLAAFPAQDLASAALGDEEAAARVRERLGEDAIAEAKKMLEAARVATARDLGDYPEVVEDIGREVVLDRDFAVRVARVGADGAVVAAATGRARPEANLFDWTKLSNLAAMLFIGGAVTAFIAVARRNPNLYLRRIGGLDAIDEALGRATEMGKPVLFVHGLEDMRKIPTIAAVNILGEVAKKVARYDTRLVCTNYDPIVLTVSQETVKEGFLQAGRPDAYNQDDIFLAGADQFSYVAAVDGMMLRQRPAANLYVGYFYAESLLLAETGAQTGAIQIAATDAYTQLPFFVTTCDYTLMGEELYAASAYLSRDPMLLGSLRGQDAGKAVVIAYAMAGTTAASLGFPLLKLLVMT